MSEAAIRVLGKRDTVFSTDRKPADFAFDKEVATVFDDMVSRSVPFYGEMQRMTVELADSFARDNTNIYDIGCSTGTTLALISESIGATEATLIGIDNSREMLEQAREKLTEAALEHPYRLECADIQKRVPIENASVVTMLLTLQFVRPLYRDKIMLQLCRGLNKGGCLLLVEKVTSENTTFNRLFIERYYGFKRRNGYSEMEISAKREALENVLIPYRVEENMALLKGAGFSQVEMFFRWYNFCGLIAIK
ncbi:MAG: carboxy-S-adenosyl-L-methionine synthase CmoA [Parvibaculaceae bacterium]|nr:carboxy-S-adenosyl-L-methionine synthase CmoA [Parvibaculaceae bacterium]